MGGGEACFPAAQEVVAIGGQFVPTPPKPKTTKKVDATPAWLAGAAHLRRAALPQREVAQPMTVGIGTMPVLRLPARLRAQQPPPQEHVERAQARTERSFARASRWPRVNQDVQTTRDYVRGAMNDSAAMRAAADHRSLDPALLDALEGADDESDAHAIRRLRDEARLLKKREQETRVVQSRLSRQVRRLGMSNPRTQRTLSVLEERGSEMQRLDRAVRTRDASFGLRAINHKQAEVEKAELRQRYKKHAEFEQDRQLAAHANRTEAAAEAVAEAWKNKERNRLLRQVLSGSVKRAADIKKSVELLREIADDRAGSGDGGGCASMVLRLNRHAAVAEEQRKCREALTVWEPMLREVEAGTVQYDPHSDWCKATYKGDAYYWKEVNGVLSFTRELPQGEGVRAVAEESRDEFQDVHSQLQKEQEGVEAVGCKYNGLSPWQMAVKSISVLVGEPEDERAYYWRENPTVFSLKQPKLGIKAVVKKDEEDFNRCWRDWVAVLEMAQKVTPNTLWPGEPAESYPLEWESRLLEIHKRMPELGSASVIYALKSCDGHAAKATKLLQQFWQHHTDLAEKGQRARFTGLTSVAIELLHDIADIQVLFQHGDYFKVRKACEDTHHRQKLEDVQLQFLEQQEQARKSPDNEVTGCALRLALTIVDWPYPLCTRCIRSESLSTPWLSTAYRRMLAFQGLHRAVDELGIEMDCVAKAAKRLDTLHAASKKDPKAGLRRIWDAADKDNSGDLDITELEEVLHMMGEKNITQAGLEAVMMEVDADGSGEIDFEEFAAWYTSMDRMAPVSRCKFLLKTARLAHESPDSTESPNWEKARRKFLGKTRENSSPFE